MNVVRMWVDVNEPVFGCVPYLHSDSLAVNSGTQYTSIFKYGADTCSIKLNNIFGRDFGAL